MRVLSRRYGPIESIEVPPAQLYEFYPGPVGFEEHHQFALITEQDSPVEWLQSLADPDVGFAVVEPFVFVPDYTFEVSDADAAALGLQRPSQAMVRVILTLRENAAAITANLLAPLVLNPRLRSGRQIVLQDSNLPLRFPVFEALGAAQSETATGGAGERAANAA